MNKNKNKNKPWLKPLQVPPNEAIHIDIMHDKERQIDISLWIDVWFRRSNTKIAGGNVS